MAELRRMIAETETALLEARAQASPPGHPRRFLEADAFAASVRLTALRDALKAVAPS